ncbi:MAG: DUF3179 domain-containing protein [Planctomycetota bacterium]
MLTPNLRLCLIACLGALGAGVTIYQVQRGWRLAGQSHASAQANLPLRAVQFTPPTPRADGWLPVDAVLGLGRLSIQDGDRLFDTVDERWRDGYAPMLLEASRFGKRHRQAVLNRLRPHAGRPIGVGRAGRDDAWQWLWRADFKPHPDYADFKAKLYARVDPRFANYFAKGRPATIRLDEVRWGGVVRDGIPPLDKPNMLSVAEATYLADTDVVFGIRVNGDARAYPKRILAWHEMFKDTVGGISLCGVYCTLCGAMIPYEATVNGVHHELGTSGFLYRSNKLMYDAATESMWSSNLGEPVIGPLVGKGVRLKALPVVTTTWGAWRKLHPETTVLSLDTGYRRNYGEGVAYAGYFATDKLMFDVPELPPPADADGPVANKAEVLALRFGAADGAGDPPLAILADFLAKQRAYHGEHAGQAFVVLTDAHGANRVYASGGRRFSWRGEQVVDETGAAWGMSEQALIGPAGARLFRLPAHRAFWFGWQAAFPKTRLIGG